MGEKIHFEEIRGIVEEGLKIMYGDIEDIDVTFCVEDKEGWRVNTSFKKRGDFHSRSALFRIDAATGEIKEFKEGLIWTV